MSLVSAGSCPHLGLNLISTLRPSEAPVNVLENRIWQPGHSLSFKRTRSLKRATRVDVYDEDIWYICLLTLDILGGLALML